MKSSKYSLANRELSWLSFSHRILQEAKDHRVPLYERIKFLGIFSSNLDEYFSVRVASLRGLVSLKKKAQKKLHVDPENLLRRIIAIVGEQQKEFGVIFRRQIIPELARQGIFLITEQDLSEHQKEFVLRYFHDNVEQKIQPTFLREDKEAPFLKNKVPYLVVQLVSRISDTPEETGEKLQYSLIEIPDTLPRFLVLPPHNDQSFIIFLDDVIRFCLPDIFPNHDILNAQSIKLTRDAQLHIEDEFSGDLLEKIKAGIEKRNNGLPCRFLYDERMPKELLQMLKEKYSLSKEDLVEGARYHNFNDLINFPATQTPALMYAPMPPLPIPELDAAPTIFEAVQKKDCLLHFPYHSFGYTTRLINEAGSDPDVSAIKITLYRVAKDSAVKNALIAAALQGKSVTAFIEAKARFDEEHNIRLGDDLEKVGVKVYRSFPELKVHAKLCLITKTLGNQQQHYAYLGTGNFNEKTARVYSDFGMLTSNERITRDIGEVFDVLSRTVKKPHCEELLVAPFSLRETILDRIDHEIRQARKGKPASIMFKMNSLEDPEMIDKLYEASMEGVKIQLIVRGICCLIPGMKKVSENIRAVSIVDRFLEHSRVYMFHNGGEELMYLSSADLMVRNLSRRIEVAWPIYDDEIKGTIKQIIGLQLHDNVKARIIEGVRNNRYRKPSTANLVQSQPATYEYLKQKRSLSIPVPIPVQSTIPLSAVEENFA